MKHTKLIMENYLLLILRKSWLQFIDN